jgi:type VI secretion system secreted protein Hcp
LTGLPFDGNVAPAADLHVRSSLVESGIRIGGSFHQATRFIHPQHHTKGLMMMGFPAMARTAAWTAASIVLLALPARAGAADQIFLKLDGVQGSSQASGHVGWIEILSFSFGVSEPATTGTATGGGGSRAKPDFSTLNVMKLADRADVPILQRLLTGRVISTATLDIVSTNGEARPEVVDQVKLTNAIIEDLQTSGANATPSVSLSIGFEKIQLVTNLYGADGAAAGTESVTYDLRTNRVTVP